MSKKCKNKQQPVTRRQFLSMAGAAGAFGAFGSPIKFLLAAICDGLISKAQAEVLGTPQKKYISLLMGGAPTRWVWDSFLRPNGPTDAFIKNRSVNNWIHTNAYSGDATGLDYLVEPVTLPGVETFYMSPIWNRTIPAINGAWVPMNTLLNNALIMRGINMGQDVGHKLGPSKSVVSESGAPSLSGAVADHSHSPIKAVGTAYSGDAYSFAERKYEAYKSSKNYGCSIVKETRYDPSFPNRFVNPLTQIINTFSDTKPAVAAYSSTTAKLQPEINAALAELAFFANSTLPGSDVLYQNRADAEALMHRSFGDLNQVYATLFNKYIDLMLRSGVAIDNIIPPNDYLNYKGSSGQFGVRGLAQQFAIAEFLFVNNLTSSITITLYEGSSPGVNGLGNKHDEHGQSDRQASMIVMTAEFRAISAMINEFRRAMGSDWSNTVIHIGAEYDRSPADSGGGSDHAADANTMTLFSGAIQKPILIGNIKTQSRNSPKYQGTWGAAAPVLTEFGTQLLNPSIAISTVATLLDIPSPSRGKSLIEKSSSGFTSLAEKPKNV